MINFGDEFPFAFDSVNGPLAASAIAERGTNSIFSLSTAKGLVRIIHNSHRLLKR